MNKIIECVPNFSEGRDLQKIDQIISPFRGKPVSYTHLYNSIRRIC